MSETQFCYSLCPSNPYNCPLICVPLPPQNYFPPPPPPTQSNQHISRIIIVVSVLAGIFILVSLCSLIIKHSSRRSTAATNTHEDNDQTNNPANRTRYVGGVGLEESEINSITVCKYRRAEGVVEGTECSICLNEFREDEDLRLLPTCSHAFHLPCIDTWLKSHENCPLCRTNVVVSSNVKSSYRVPNSDPGSGERPQVGSSQSSTGLGRNRIDGVIANHNSVPVGTSELRDLPSSHMNNGFRSNSDLIENNRPRVLTIEMMDVDIKRFRRSFSMDSSAARMISNSLANVLPTDSEGSSTSEGDMGSKCIGPKCVRNQTTCKIRGNCSDRGASSQERPAFVLKRSFSGGSKFLFTRCGRSRDSILPM